MRYSLSGSESDTVKPLLVLPFYLFREVESRVNLVLVLRLDFYLADLSGRHSQVGSLAGAAYLLNDNAGVLW
jgi:hypothetical protein